MPYLIIEEYENEKLARFITIDKTKPAIVHDLEFLTKIGKMMINKMFKRNESLKNDLIKELGKSEHEISNFLGQSLLRDLSWAAGFVIRFGSIQDFGSRALIEIEDKVIFTMASPQKIKEALKHEGDSMIKVHFSTEKDSFVVIKEELKNL